MGTRNRERIARIRAGLEKPLGAPTDPKEKAAKGLCPFPGCSGDAIYEKPAHGFCLTHEKFVADLVFILPHIKWQEAKTPGGLVLPGSPEFTAPVQIEKSG